MLCKSCIIQIPSGKHVLNSLVIQIPRGKHDLDHAHSIDRGSACSHVSRQKRNGDLKRLMCVTMPFTQLPECRSCNIIPHFFYSMSTRALYLLVVEACAE